MASKDDLVEGDNEIEPAAILHWRNQMGFSQRAAAEALGCARDTLRAWEAGQSRIPLYIGFAMTAVMQDLPCYGRKLKPKRRRSKPHAAV